MRMRLFPGDLLFKKLPCLWPGLPRNVLLLPPYDGLFFEHCAVDHLLAVELQFGDVGDFDDRRCEVLLVLVEALG